MTDVACAHHTWPPPAWGHIDYLNPASRWDMSNRAHPEQYAASADLACREWADLDGCVKASVNGLDRLTLVVEVDCGGSSPHDPESYLFATELREALCRYARNWLASADTRCLWWPDERTQDERGQSMPDEISETHVADIETRAEVDGEAHVVKIEVQADTEPLAGLLEGFAARIKSLEDVSGDMNARITLLENAI